MCSARDNAALPALGFPIRASAGHWPFSASPRLIAAVHALHRLLVPRHPPCALNILTVIGEKSWRTFPLEKSCDFSGGQSGLFPLGEIRKDFSIGKRRYAFTRYPCHWLLCSFQGPRRGARRAGPRTEVHERRRRAGLSKLNSTRVIR